MSELAIRIYWGAEDGDLQTKPIVKVGNLVDGYEPAAPTLANDDRVWMMVNGSRYNTYSGFERVKTDEGKPAIQLLISLFIPTGHRLANGKSPLEMLEDLRKKFGEVFTLDLEATLPHPAIVDAAFRQVAGEFPLEECPFYVFQMEGTSPGAFRVENTTQLSALMRFSNYNPIAHISCLEMSFNCNPTLKLNTKGNTVDTENPPSKKSWREKRAEKKGKGESGKGESGKVESGKVESGKGESGKVESGKGESGKGESGKEESGKEERTVPVSPKYQIYVNAEATNVFLQSDSERYVVHKDGSEDVRFEDIRVSFEDFGSYPDQVLRTPSGNSMAFLDEKGHRIICVLNPIEKRYEKRTVEFTDDSEADAVRFFVDNVDKTIQILVDGKPWHERIKPSEWSIARKDKKISISPTEAEGCKFSVSSVRIDGEKDALAVVVRAKKKMDVLSYFAKNKLLVVSFIVGLALGIGGMCGLNYWKHSKAEKERIATAKIAENNAYTYATTLPVHNKDIKDGIENQDEDYLDLLQTANGIHPYYEYLKNYGPDNKDAYNANHYNDIISRRDTYQADSADYVECFESKKALLYSLNQRDQSAFRGDKEKCLSPMEYDAARWLVFGSNITNAYFHFHRLHELEHHLRKKNLDPKSYWREQHEIEHKIENDIQQEVDNIIAPYRDKKGFRFKDWGQVRKVYTQAQAKAEMLVEERIEYLERQAAIEKNQEKANAAFNKIKEENSKKKTDYANIIKLCEDYQDTYKGVSTENDTQVANILANAQKKQETAANDEKTRKQVEKEALNFLNKAEDATAYRNWLDQKTDGKENREWLGGQKANWIDKILSNSIKRTGFREKYPNGTTDWNEIKKAASK